MPMRQKSYRKVMKRKKRKMMIKSQRNEDITEEDPNVKFVLRRKQKRKLKRLKEEILVRIKVMIKKKRIRP